MARIRIQFSKTFNRGIEKEKPNRMRHRNFSEVYERAGREKKKEKKDGAELDMVLVIVPDYS